MNNFNKTQLYIDKATERGIVHRDYLAHTLRWTHVLKHAKVGMKVLDIGCGVNLPLAMTLYTNRYKPERYLGLELRTDVFPPAPFPFTWNVFKGFDVTNERHWLKEYIFNEKWDIAVCFEVLEHMEKPHGIALLNNIAMLDPHTEIFFSTPCFNGSKAANHIYEWRYEELKNELAQRFRIKAHYGTFASQADILPVATDYELAIFNELKKYYDSNLLAILLAPLHPERSRNCLWHMNVIP